VVLVVMMMMMMMMMMMTIIMMVNMIGMTMVVAITMDGPMPRLQMLEFRKADEGTQADLDAIDKEINVIKIRCGHAP
jgi:hypothetical protein